MAKHNLGLISVELGEIESDGALSTSLAPVGETVIGSATMTTADATVTDFNIEESDSPIESVVTAPGKVTFAWSTYNIEPAEMVRFFGGTLTAGDTENPGGTWAAPDTFIENELSVVLTDKKGNVFQIPRAKLSSKMSISFSKSKLGQIDVTATVLQPELAGLARIKFLYV